PQPVQMRGVVSARVIDHNDPRGMGRLQVKYDWQEEGETGWARMISPHAGSDRGVMFMPEKGDEGLVAFEQGEPERPVILGALWNGVNIAPRTGFWANAGVMTQATSRPHPQAQDLQGEIVPPSSEISNEVDDYPQPQQQHLRGSGGAHPMQIPN